MHANYLHRQCSKTARKFFEDYDLLPVEVKRLLQEQPRMPNFDDLKEAWQLAGELFNIDLLDGKLRLNAFEAERKEKERKEADRKRREEKEAARRERSLRKWGLGQTETHYIKRTREDQSKHGNLVRRVIDAEEAARLLTSRKENKDVVSGARVYYEAVTVPVKKEEKKQQEPLKFQENLPQNSLVKQWHNG